MGTIPFPNIPEAAGEIAQAPANAFAQGVGIRGAQQEQQERSLQMEQQRRQLADQDALTKAMTSYDPQKHTLADFPKLVTQNGGSGQAALTAQAGLIQQRRNLSSLSDEQFAQEQKKADLIQGVHDEVSQAAPEQKQQVYQRGLQRLSGAGVDVSQESPQFPGDDVFAQHLPAIRLHSALIAEADRDREISAQEAKGRFENAQAAHQELINNLAKNTKPEDLDKQVDAMLDPRNAQTAGPNQFVKAQVRAALARGDFDGATKFIDQAYQSQLGLQKDIAEKTNPAIQAAELHLAAAKKAMEEAISDGDPKAAAKLLVDGTVAPSQLISSRKPAFAQQAFTAAAQMQPGWTATKADADYKVASSPTNVAFFGSAKSLTDKGGTLDQLADAAKDIPDGKIPVFNSIADAMRASTGSGPVAKYASILLGVADDYSKVMGGGQGSDTSRTQALSLVPAKASPAARAAALEGIRGAVGSQINSRIGNNAVLQKMYGSSAPSTPKGGDDFFSKFGGQAK